ncbi:MAG: hypothetical protein KAI02_06705 [Gammaproteobacteria bacterium]|nr:hypothetical protein [Gammaproteobacteria bacterium]
MNIRSYLIVFLGSIILFFCLSTYSIAAQSSNNNAWRSMPFIEIMAAMMKAMNNVVSGHNNSFDRFNSLPYSPIFTPSMEMLSPSNRFNNDFKDSDTHPSQPKDIIDNDSINGIWQSVSGDVLAIYNNNRFLWSDGQSRNLVGYLMIKGNKMIAYVPAKQATLYFQIHKTHGKFIVRDINSRTYSFKRLH